MAMPVLTPTEVKAVDERALEKEPLEVILDRVGAALAREVISILGGTYGRRINALIGPCLLYTSPSPRDRQKSRMPSSA